jgi:16S rRNA (guanine527-N7)-methyltransferase
MPGADQQQVELPSDLDLLLAGARQIGLMSLSDAQRDRLTAKWDDARRQQIALRLSDAQLAQFARYRDLLLEWNQRFNLTAITDPQEVLTKHFLDSLAFLLAIPTHFKVSGKLTLLDVGSGAGFPGLPLQIVYPSWQITLLEATGKKVRFLEAVIADLGLSQTRAIQGRAEDLAHDPQHRAAYDLVTARALAALPTLLEYCLPFCAPGGLVIAAKKGDISAELERSKAAAVKLGGRWAYLNPFSLPGLEDQRALVVYQQTQPAPAHYPRRAGAPLKHPLG